MQAIKRALNSCYSPFFDGELHTINGTPITLYHCKFKFSLSFINPQNTVLNSSSDIPLVIISLTSKSSSELLKCDEAYVHRLQCHASVYLVVSRITPLLDITGHPADPLRIVDEIWSQLVLITNTQRTEFDSHGILHAALDDIYSHISLNQSNQAVAAAQEYIASGGLRFQYQYTATHE